MTSNHKLGLAGEKIACDYLIKINYSILEQNWRSGKYGEIDLIAYDINKKELVFVEVKSRATSTNDAKELVTPKKQRQLYKLATSYLHLFKKGNQACRFDVIAIKINNDKRQIEHIRNAFYLH